MQYHLVHAQHGIYRGADLMAHMCQELTLGFVGTVSYHPLLPELLVLGHLLPEVHYEHYGYGSSHYDQRDQEEDDRYDVVHARLFSAVQSLLQYIPDPDAQHYAAKRAHRHYGEVASLQHCLHSSVYVYIPLASVAVQAPVYSPYQEHIGSRAQQRAGIVER